MKTISSNVFSFVISSLAKFNEFCNTLGELVEPPLTIALNGQLGSGKTTFVRALCKGLGCSSLEFVTSPTFVLMQEYQARCPVYHFDVYRLTNESQFLDFDSGPIFSGQNVVLVEWAEKIINCLPAKRLNIFLEVLGPEERKIEIHFLGGTDYPRIRDYLLSLSTPR